MFLSSFILLYHFLIFFRYAIVYQKGYQDFDIISTASLTKVKGVDYVHVPEFDPIPDVTDRIWDVADYVVPPEVRVVDYIMYHDSYNV